MSREAALAAVQNNSQFNIIHPSAGKVDVYVLGDSPHDESRLGRARRTESAPGLFGSLAAPEDVILKKLEFFRASGHERHIRDTAGMLAVSGSQLDPEYIGRWAVRLGVADLWSHVRGSVR